MSNRRPQEARRPWSWLIFDVGQNAVSARDFVFAKTHLTAQSRVEAQSSPMNAAPKNSWSAAMRLVFLVLAGVGVLVSVISAALLWSAMLNRDTVMQAVGTSGVIIGAGLAARVLYVRKHPEHKRDFQNTYWL